MSLSFEWETLFIFLLNSLAVLFTFWIWQQEKQSTAITRHPVWSPLSLVLGLLMLNAAVVYLWRASFGIEFGIVFYFVATSIITWLLILLRSLREPKKHTKTHQKKRSFIARPTAQVVNNGFWRERLWRRCISFLLAGPWTLIVCLALAALWVLMYPGKNANALVSAALLLPILWGIGASWLVSQPKRLKPFIVSLVFVVTMSIGLVGGCCDG
ncbi:MAG: hypothetical protein HWE13_06005 [Gammaproteobacteria bacterium]|nr:hypothetical protein [Gammaproteobacteria bacterium]